jgi:hypothetical protein
MIYEEFLQIFLPLHLPFATACYKIEVPFVRWGRPSLCHHLYLSVVFTQEVGPFRPRDKVTPRGSWHPGPSFVPVCCVCKRLALFSP